MDFISVCFKNKSDIVTVIPVTLDSEEELTYEYFYSAGKLFFFICNLFSKFSVR